MIFGNPDSNEIIPMWEDRQINPFQRLNERSVGVALNVMHSIERAVKEVYTKFCSLPFALYMACIMHSFECCISRQLQESVIHSRVHFSMMLLSMLGKTKLLSSVLRIENAMLNAQIY